MDPNFNPDPHSNPEQDPGSPAVAVVPVQVVGPPAPERPPKKRRSLLGFLFIFFLLIGLGGSMLLNLVLLSGRITADSGGRVQEKHFSHERSALNKVAIISAEGVILESRGFVKQQIDRAMKDDSVKAVVLRVNSPGGTVTASDYLYHHLKKLTDQRKIPLVVSMGGIAASGGYYLSMAVGTTPQSIFAEPATWTGSIGVIIPHYDASDLLKNIGVKQDSVSSHPLKGMGSFAKPMTPQERQIFQGLVDDSFNSFKEIVRAGRPKFKENPSALDKLATGQVFTADQAVGNGLVDKIGFLEDAVDRAVELSGVNKDEVTVVEYKPEFSLVESLMGSSARAPSFDAVALLEMAVPRAYYLWSWVPSEAAKP